MTPREEMLAVLGELDASELPDVLALGEFTASDPSGYM
jgi:hypothetical protein